MTRARYKTEVKLFALNERAEGKKWAIIQDRIKERFNVNPPGIRVMEKWKTSLNSESIRAELMKDANEELPRLETEAKTKVIENLLPVLLSAQSAGVDMESAAWKWFFESIENLIGLEKFERYATEYFATRKQALTRASEVKNDG
jgi:hypothetical protein